jgi:hypothetical protein
VVDAELLPNPSEVFSIAVGKAACRAARARSHRQLFSVERAALASKIAGRAFDIQSNDLAYLSTMPFERVATLLDGTCPIRAVHTALSLGRRTADC